MKKKKKLNKCNLKRNESKTENQTFKGYRLFFDFGINFFLVLLISPGNGNRSLALGAIWASEESLSTWLDRWNQ